MRIYCTLLLIISLTLQGIHKKHRCIIRVGSDVQTRFLPLHCFTWLVRVQRDVAQNLRGRGKQICDGHAISDFAGMEKRSLIRNLKRKCARVSGHEHLEGGVARRCLVQLAAVYNYFCYARRTWQHNHINKYLLEMICSINVESQTKLDCRKRSVVAASGFESMPLWSSDMFFLIS